MSSAYLQETLRDSAHALTTPVLVADTEADKHMEVWKGLQERDGSTRDTEASQQPAQAILSIQSYCLSRLSHCLVRHNPKLRGALTCIHAKNCER